MSRTEIMATEEYNPFVNREREGQTTNIQALILMVRAIVGTGILALPEAFKHSGFIGGTIGITCIVILMAYTQQLLYAGRLFLCKKEKIPEISFADSMQMSFEMGPQCFRKIAKFMPGVVNGILLICQEGIQCVYVIFIASNVKQFIDIILDDENANVNTEMYITILIIPLLLIMFIRQMTTLSVFMNIANWIELLAIICIHYFFFQDMPSFGSRNMFGSPSNYPLFLGTTVFAVTSIITFLSIEANMKNGEDFLGIFGILNQGIFISGAVNFIVGFFGYWKYGDECRGSVTLNIDFTHPVTQVIRIAFAVAIYISYGLKAFPIVEIVWREYLTQHMETSQHKLLWEFAIRCTVVFVSYICAVFIPHLGLFISLVGAFCLTVVGMILPPLLDLCTYWEDDKAKRTLIITTDILLILFGLFIWISGTSYSIKAIVLTFF